MSVKSERRKELTKAKAAKKSAMLSAGQESNYAVKLAARRKGTTAGHPLPAPMETDYTRPYAPKEPCRDFIPGALIYKNGHPKETGMYYKLPEGFKKFGGDAFAKLLPHEDPRLIGKFKRPHFY